MQQPLELVTGGLDPDSCANSPHPVSHRVKGAQSPVSSVSSESARGARDEKELTLRVTEHGLVPQGTQQTEVKTEV